MENIPINRRQNRHTNKRADVKAKIQTQLDKQTRERQTMRQTDNNKKQDIQAADKEDKRTNKRKTDKY